VQLVPLFPLPNVVLFPDVPLPLHVFEPRYRSLVRDALGSHRSVGMALLKPGYEADYHGCPAIYPLGCVGSIVEDERLDDGRFNIVLQGRQRFRIVRETQGGAYRQALVEPLAEAAHDDASPMRLRDEVLRALGRLAGEASLVLPGGIPGATLVNALCQGLDLPAVEKLDLLGCDSVESRARRLVELLEFHRLERGAGQPAQMN
jgi:Lon protease-like protein